MKHLKIKGSGYMVRIVQNMM